MPKRLTQAQIKKCLEVKPILMAVQSATGVPWEALAGIWYRESFSVTPPKKPPGGSFQFDPVPPDNRLRFLLDRYSNLSTEKKLDCIAKGVNDFESAAYFAACHGRDHCNPKIHPGSPDADIQDFLWGYNGKAFGAATKSNYVMSGYDKSYDNMRIRGTVPDGKGGRIRVDNADARPGAYVVYKQLKGELK